MVHARPDYNRFQDPALTDPSLLGEGCSPIAEDEPVMLFRAKDKHFIGILQDYARRIAADNDADEVERHWIGTLLRLHEESAREWQRDHGTKAPDVPDFDLDPTNADGIEY